MGIFKLFKVINLAVAVASCFASAEAQESKMVYELKYCELGDVSSVLIFRDVIGNAKHIAFMERYQEFALKTPTLKGLVEWASVDAIDLLRIPDKPNERFVSVVLKDGRKIELGAADNMCLSKIKKRYRDDIYFNEVE